MSDRTLLSDQKRDFAMASPPRSFAFGDFTLDEAAQELRLRGRRVPLAATPFRLLLYLVAQREQTVSKEELFDAVWREVAVSEATLASTLNSVRQALGDDAATQRWIETRRGQGYRFIGSVEERPTGEASKARIGRGRVWRPEIAAGLLLAAGAALLWWRVSTPIRSLEPVRSLAVLPLIDLSGDPEQEYFADGMTELLILRLGQIRSLRVTSRTSVMQYKGTTKSMTDIAEELGVETIVEGSVAREDGRVRVTVQLIDTRNDAHLWAQAYDRDLRDLHSLQNDIARAVADQVQAQLTPAEARLLRRTPQVEPDAQDAYFKGSYHLLSFENPMQHEFETARAYFLAAIEADPDWALPHAALSLAHYFLASFRPPNEEMPKAKEAALRALELDPDLSEAHYRLGWVALHYDWDAEQAGRHFMRALELDPSSSRTGYARYLGTIGRHEEAIEQMRKQREVAPLEILHKVNLAVFLYWGGYPERAVRELHAILEAEPEQFHACSTLIRIYEDSESEEAVDPACLRAVLPEEALAARREAFATHGARGLGQWSLAAMREQAETGWVDPMRFVRAHLLLRELDLSFEWLGRAYETRSKTLTDLRVDPQYDVLRGDPRFEDLVRRVGIPAG